MIQELSHEQKEGLLSQHPSAKPHTGMFSI